MSTFAEVQPTGSPTGRLVSVVTPFYNTAAFLEQAIRSVLAQSYKNFEYLLCDNCSNDGSLDIARRYAALDSRIRVVTHEECVAQLPNYNRALRYISPDSQYCKMVQADDWIYPNCLAEMVSLAEANSTIAIVGCCFLAGDELAGQGLPFDRSVFAGREACRTRLLSGGTYFGSPTCLLYRSDVVRHRNPFFNIDDIAADTTACFEILLDAAFGRVPQILVYLRRGNASISDRLRRLEASSFVNYALVERYGPQYLSAGEFGERRRVLERSYLRVLARAAVKRPGKEFWAFHTEMMASLGKTLPMGRVGLQLSDLVLNKMLNPRQTIEAAIDSWGRRRSRRESS